MIVTAILRTLMRAADAVARANRLRAERLVQQHLARAGGLGQGR